MARERFAVEFKSEAVRQLAFRYLQHAYYYLNLGNIKSRNHYSVIPYL